jgi:phenylalanine-4-hydroxylase
MIDKKPNYVAKAVDEQGNAAYTSEDNIVWQTLITRQKKMIEERACNEFIHGLELLNLPQTRVPQCHEVSAVLQKATGWSLEPVPALISFDRFFHLLANRKFPAATFIRRMEDLDYIKEPDIFHEIFGHCPLLTNTAYAEFVHNYGKIGLKATPEERVLLARLFWFTIEFGLLKTPQGLRAYGGGILSSPNETIYSLESEIPERKPFNAEDALRTSYRYDVIQPIYFVLQIFDQLFEIINLDLIALIHDTQGLGKQAQRHPC